MKNTKLKWFYPDSNLDSDFVYVFRREPSWRWIRVDDSYISQKPELQEMEAVYGKYGEGKVLNYTGVVNNSDVTKSFESGYYLVSNPFPVAIDWDKDEGWEREGFSTTIWSWITINGYRTVQTINNGVAAIKPEGYSDENASHIPPYQAVQMKVVAGNAKLTIKREARVKNSNAPLKSAAGQQSSYNLIRIQTDNNLQIDGTLIYFNDTFINGASDEDSEKQFNSSENVPEIYTRINNSAYAINGFPELTDSEYSIPISVRNRVEADVTMAFDLKEFGGGYTVYLEDKETGSWINLLQQSEYVYTPAQMGDDHDRFVLHLEKIQQVATGINQPDTESTDDIEIVGYEDYAQIQISNELLQTSDAEIDLLDMNGRLLNKVTTRQTQNNVDLPDNSGVYIIRVNIGDVVKTGKVVR
ncbi:T9SS type A sorting domain-containing protein [Anaerophaga thermohalophila]|uniref:T9SS type A sorting domain-containing protein n=1 Tax=Anaerophaga thermohalophila TaxID=177400 RepID=UPI00111277CA|nr:T9SS type A sorting domain-containing protein [Anaerophaga thermohalophila]